MLFGSVVGLDTDARSVKTVLPSNSRNVSMTIAVSVLLESDLFVPLCGVCQTGRSGECTTVQ